MSRILDLVDGWATWVEGEMKTLDPALESDVAAWRALFAPTVEKAIMAAFLVGLKAAGKDLSAISADTLQTVLKQAQSQLPPAHLGVYTRLQKSRNGVGVFAILDIPEKTNVFDGDAGELRDIDDSDLNDIPSEIRQLYDDFCPRKGGRLKGPSNFNNLTVGWYLNHSDTPNVRCDEHFDFIATRLIKKGEELTADYRTYDEQPLNFTPCSGSDPAA